MRCKSISFIKTDVPNEIHICVENGINCVIVSKHFGNNFPGHKPEHSEK